MECIICRDNGLESLIDNTSCNCKYKYHNSCWIDYVHSQKTVKCLMCRKHIVPKKQNTIRSLLSSTPYAFSSESIAIYNPLNENVYQELNNESSILHDTNESNISNRSVSILNFTCIRKAFLIMCIAACFAIIIVSLI